MICRLADDLEALAAQPEAATPLQTAVLARRAAIAIRNKPGMVLDHETELAVGAFAAEFGMGRKEALNRIVTESLIAMGYLAWNEVDEASDVAGSG